MTMIEKIKSGLIETGIYIRVEKDGKWQPVDYINLLPEQVQDKDRWDNKNWRKICDSILAHIGACFVENNQVIDDRSIIIGVLTLLRELNIEGRQP